jgi:hypothetical protein
MDMTRPTTPRWEPGGDRRAAALGVIKAVHTLWWLVVESAMAYVLYAGVRGRTDRRAAVAGSIVTAEGIVFIAAGARCPLTGVAESLGADRGSVTDLYLPRWLARNLPAIHVPLVAAAIALHLRHGKRSR